MLTVFSTSVLFLLSFLIKKLICFIFLAVLGLQKIERKYREFPYGVWELLPSPPTPLPPVPLLLTFSIISVVYLLQLVNQC